MNNVVIKGNDIVNNETSNNITFSNNVLNIPNNLVLEDTLRVSLKERSNKPLEINVGKNANLKIMVEIEDNDTSKVNYNIKLNASSNAFVNYLLVTTLKSNEALINHEFNANNDATINVYGGFLNNVIRVNLNCNLNGTGGSIDVKTVTISSDDHSQQIDVYMNNNAPKTLGYMTSIGIANKRGKVILNGIEKIEKGMKRSDVYQTLKGIITSDDAYIEVNPILLIDEYDLEAAGHAATVGKLEEEALYYLMSRGLTKEQAEKLIVSGFLRPVIDEIEDEELKDKFNNLVDMRI